MENKEQRRDNRARRGKENGSREKQNASQMEPTRIPSPLPVHGCSILCHLVSNGNLADSHIKMARRALAIAALQPHIIILLAKAKIETHFCKLLILGTSLIIE